MAKYIIEDPQGKIVEFYNTADLCKHFLDLGKRLRDSEYILEQRKTNKKYKISWLLLGILLGWWIKTGFIYLLDLIFGK